MLENVCVCVCMCERESEREREKGGGSVCFVPRASTSMHLMQDNGFSCNVHYGCQSKLTCRVCVSRAVYNFSLYSARFAREPYTSLSHITLRIFSLSLPRTSSKNDIYISKRATFVWPTTILSLSCLSILHSSFDPFGFSLRLLRLFHFALPLPSPRRSRRGDSPPPPVATLRAADINKHLDYTVKAASTTMPGWKLEDSPPSLSRREAPPHHHPPPPTSPPSLLLTSSSSFSLPVPRAPPPPFLLIAPACPLSPPSDPHRNDGEHTNAGSRAW